MTSLEETQTRRGMYFALGAYGAWGLIPFYFKLVQHVSPVEVLAQRILWSFGLLALLVLSLGRRRELRAVLRTRRVMLTLLASTTLIGFNWLTYIYAIGSNQVLQASLGYFIAPLVNVLLGVVCLKERLRRNQLVSFGLAGLGVALLTLQGGGFPGIALALAVSFGIYGLLRKTVAVDGLMGLFVETMLLLPLAALYAGTLIARGDSAFIADGRTAFILACSGVVTVCPLLAFAAAARRLRLATLGFIQYLTPSLQFLLAIFVFAEPFSSTQLVSFACIWTAVGLYSLDSAWTYRQSRRVVAREPREALLPAAPRAEECPCPVSADA